jgi:ATP-dependent DNA ligase
MMQVNFKPYRQKYREVDLTAALASDRDIFQVKYDGIWAAVHVDGGLVEVFSRTDALKRSFTIPDHMHQAVFVAEFMFGSERAQTHAWKDKLVVFDCLYFDTIDVAHEPYEERLKLARVALNNLTGPFQLAPTYRVKDATTAWEVGKQRNFEGLVFRRTKDKYSDELLKVKYEIEDEFYVIDMIEGQGKHEGRLGALVVSDRRGGSEVMRVGGGFNDRERQFIWDHCDYHIGKCVQVKGKGRFESGALRHPNFVKWRDDK